MLQEDYLMRMFSMLITAIRESILRAGQKEDPEAAAKLLDNALDGATEIDGSLLLSLAPETMSLMLQMSETDPKLMEYVSRTLLLSSKFYGQAGQLDMSQLRSGQAHAVASTFGLELADADIEPENLESFFGEAEEEGN